MTVRSTNEAAIPNPALEPFRVLVGEWNTIGSHPGIPDTVLHGRARFEWIEGGAFMMLHTEIDEPGVPSGISIFGSDDATGELYMLYFDERGVSRKLDMTMHDNVWKWWRNAPGFSQRYSITIAEGGNRMIARGELSKDGKTWEKDLELTYTRA